MNQTVHSTEAFVNLADYLRHQFAYNEWANQEVLTAVQAGGAEERPMQLLAHILSAERLWLERIQQKPQTLPVWPKPDFSQLEKQTTETARLWREYLEPITAGDVSETVSYKNTKGEPWTSSILDILTHVVMHSAYHRGQIASHMRAGGQTPAYTDFIHAVRQGRVK